MKRAPLFLRRKVNPVFRRFWCLDHCLHNVGEHTFLVSD